MKRIKAGWINLTDWCNLSCPWCYNQKTVYGSQGNMEMHVALGLIDLLQELGSQEAVFIGGEPTLHSGLLEIIKYTAGKGIKASLITNGFRLHDYDYLSALLSAGLGEINFSLKGYSEESYFANTGLSEYSNYCLAIKNVKAADVAHSFSLVIGSQTAKHLVDYAQFASDMGIHHLHLSLETDRIDFSGKASKEFAAANVCDRIELFSSQYQMLDEIMEGRIYLIQPYPLCLWDSDLIGEMRRKGQFGYGCQLLFDSGVVFDVEGRLIPCNMMVGHPALQQFDSVTNCESLLKLRNNEIYKEIICELKSYPAQACIDCENFSSCLGGCPMQWFQYDLSTLRLIKKEKGDYGRIAKRSERNRAEMR